MVARRNGVQVDGITLWMLGGAARLHSRGRDPRSGTAHRRRGSAHQSAGRRCARRRRRRVDALQASGLMVERFTTGTGRGPPARASARGNNGGPDAVSQPDSGTTATGQAA
ncbi:hypothetical protein [Streptomyces sp. NPDC007205]|uniref:hypothetical protein n=1 Tax=Streptomyces sp. NPDC007205 TaxID=3154316 RepID=UPI0033D91AD1